VQGERVRLGQLVAAFTVQQILRAAGISSAPRPARPGSRSCPPRASGILAVDFVHADTVLLRRLHALIIIEL
jgi:putative transposase